MTAYRTQSRSARNAKSANGFRSMEMVKEVMAALFSMSGFQSSILRASAYRLFRTSWRSA